MGDLVQLLKFAEESEQAELKVAQAALATAQGRVERAASAGNAGR